MSTKKAIIVGASSGIAIELAKKLAQDGWEIILSARNPTREEWVASHISQFGNARPAGLGTPEAIWTREWKKSPCALLVIASGTLPGAPELASPEETTTTFQANTLLPIEWCQLAAASMASGTICVIGSVAGDRGRASNHIYGAAKAAIETYCEGLGHRLAGKVHVCLVKPGITRTGMTADLKNSPLISSPETVAKSILAAIKKKKSKCYAPGWWWGIMTLIKWLPEKVIWKTKL